MSCQILHLENLAKHLNKLWYWDPDRLLSRRTGNGKRKGYRSSKLILKSKSGLNRLIAPNTESKCFLKQNLNLYIHWNFSTQASLAFLFYTGGKLWPPWFQQPYCVSKARNSGLSHRSQFPNSPLAHSTTCSNKTVQEKSTTNSCWLSTPLNAFLQASVSSLFQHKSSLAPRELDISDWYKKHAATNSLTSI